MSLKEFKIGWFATILGTGGVAIASLPYFPVLSVVLTYLLTAIFVILTAVWLAKIIRYPRVVAAELGHFVMGNFYPLQPISAVILAILYRKLGIPLDLPLLAYGAGLILVLTVYLSYHFFANVKAEIHHIHGGWFIPPVSTILVTDALLQYSPNETFFVTSLIYFGIGLMLFLFISTILFLRLVNHELPVFELAPTNFILLAPIGILIVDFTLIAKHAEAIFSANLVPLALIASISLWGFGLWALAVNILLLLRYLRQEMPFFLGWWSYVFPTAAYTLSTIALSHFVPVFSYAATALYAFLIAAWAIIGVRTVGIAIRGA
ncbi:MULTISPECIES: tellurite-resistance/dicarboxylate transporter [Archaeoglobus]|jgi:C4-dicarboxylate transporter/malic acid transport protein|uniref:C4-dicarboxylate transporter (Mae1) n=3 Tax=Archaeoglobus fulgidus TaxID=2234 RepID=O29900_ARCFU|nr:MULTISPECIES: tellurite-resistance/dicarboxylate transporter [Archaeoglobus]AAB90885.1 C4-dicarboxylate transporter (mae1) [Archaeoglobus fulgidus DSM 4304]AIG97168.1 C4-dicarboxylate transporter/malic acid transport protein [Archaeoglobus fulgidus DSM 8774]KUJ94321.1 MAG: C4-dicarboxylate transporter (Mae1) [Archaeoglobus fulgidus]KUK06379.1 MAG: C4-dicarboxylate transporter (Mae1) [Archaeoglobus fulgidus]MDI3497195.1 hypothetical protein [Archaeoglobus sp.]